MLTLWIGTECNFSAASCTPNVEAVDGDIEVSFLKRLFAGVELAASVDIFAAVGAFHGERCHQSDSDDLWALLTKVLGRAPNRRRVKVGWVVLAQDLSLRHLEGVGGGWRLEKEKWR